MNCILPRTARKTDFGALYLLSCLWMTAPMSYFVLWCGHSRDSNGYHCVTASWMPYLIHITRCDHSPCAELGFSTPHNMIELDDHHGDRQKNKNRKAIPWLSSSRSDCHVLQRRCQPRPTPIYCKGGRGGGVDGGSCCAVVGTGRGR